MVTPDPTNGGDPSIPRESFGGRWIRNPRRSVGLWPRLPIPRKPAARLAMSSAMNHDEIGVCPGDLLDSVERRFSIRVPCDEGDPALHTTGADRAGETLDGSNRALRPARSMASFSARRARTSRGPRVPPEVVPGRPFYVPGMGIRGRAPPGFFPSRSRSSRASRATPAPMLQPAMRIRLGGNPEDQGGGRLPRHPAVPMPERAWDGRVLVPATEGEANGIPFGQGSRPAECSPDVISESVGRSRLPLATGGEGPRVSDRPSPPRICAFVKTPPDSWIRALASARKASVRRGTGGFRSRSGSTHSPTPALARSQPAKRAAERRIQKRSMPRLR